VSFTPEISRIRKSKINLTLEAPTETNRINPTQQELWAESKGIATKRVRKVKRQKRQTQFSIQSKKETECPNSLRPPYVRKFGKVST